MKSSFNFLQVTNWLIVCRDNLLKIRDDVLTESISKQEAIKRLEAEKNKLTIIKEVLERKRNLMGIQPDFLKKLKEIKKEYGIED
jgi:hypothetical protein